MSPIPIYIKIKKNLNDKGCWEIDLIGGRALFRAPSQITPDIIVENKITDYSKKYGTITDFLKLELKYKFVKEIIRNRKFVFSNKVFCSYSIAGRDRHHPTLLWYCDNEAEFKLEGKPFCSNHVRVK